MTKSFYTAAAWLGIGATFFTIYFLLVNLKLGNKEVLSVNLSVASLYIGILFVLIGLIFLFVCIFYLIKNGVSKTSLVVLDYLDFWHYEAHPASEPELTLIYNMAFALFGGDVSPVEEMKIWQAHNDKIFWVVKKKGKTEIVGYFCVIPLLKKAAKLVEREELTGAEIKVEHITSGKHNSKPYALYVGAVAANGLLAQGAAMNHLTSFFNFMHSNKVRNIYTRPVTKIGLKRSLEKGFKPVDKKLRDTPLSRTYHLAERFASG